MFEDFYKINPTVDSPLIISIAFKNGTKDHLESIQQNGYDNITEAIKDNNAKVNDNEIIQISPGSNDDRNIKIPGIQVNDISADAFSDVLIKISALGYMTKSKGWSYEQKQQIINFNNYIVNGHSYYGMVLYI